MSRNKKNVMCVFWILSLVLISFIGSFSEVCGNIAFIIMTVGTVVYQEIIEKERVFLLDYTNIIGMFFLYDIMRINLF